LAVNSRLSGSFSMAKRPSLAYDRFDLTNRDSQREVICIKQNSSDPP
jgi:hypothetical protein